MIFATKKTIASAIAGQLAFEKKHPEPYSPDQRVEAVCQRVEQLANSNRHGRLQREVEKCLSAHSACQKP